MIRRTYGEVADEIARIAGVTGMATTDARVMSYVNQAIEELMLAYDWPSVIDRYNFKSYGGTITLPYGYERLMALSINGLPMQLQSPWFEFVGWGLDLICEANIGDSDAWDQFEGVLDRDQVCLFSDIPAVSIGTQYTLRVATTCDERVSGAQPSAVIIKGLDGNYQPIRTANKDGTYIEGVQFDFYQGGPYQISTDPQVFAEVTGVIKPVTREPLNLYRIPVGGSAQTQIGRWGALETCPVYRRYKIKGLTDTSQYTYRGRLRKRFAKITTDNDFVLISNLPALKAMVMAVYYLESRDAKNYAQYKAIAIDILKNEAKAYIGLQRQKPLITVAEDTMSRCGTYIL